MQDKESQGTTPPALRSHANSQQCGGDRPRCQRCIDKNVECSYETEEGETRFYSLKRKHNTIEQEVQDLRMIYEYIRKRSEPEAYEIFRRMRQTSDPVELLHFIKEGDMLLSATTPAHTIESGDADPTAEKLDADALSENFIKVSARPWTVVAGDGLVSELLSEFFAIENVFLLPALEQDVFLQELRERDPNKAKYCSPLLVNAMCAQRCVTSSRAKALGALTKRNMLEAFLDESKKLLEIECGRASIPTVLALCVMYLCVTTTGRDRAATIFRFMAMEMTKRLGLESRYAKLKDDDGPQAVLQKRILSKTLWGLFCFETRVSYFYFQRALIRPPSLPRYYDDDDDDNDDDDEVEEEEEDEGDEDGDDEDEDSSPSEGQNINTEAHPQSLSSDSSTSNNSFGRLSIVPGIINAICDLSEIFYDIMTLNTISGSNLNRSSTERSGKDVDDRVALYKRLANWSEALPQKYQPDHNFTFQSCWLRTFANETTVCLLQALPGNTKFQGSGERSVKDMIIACCETDTGLFERYMKTLPCVELLIRSLYLSTSSLIPFLDDADTHVLFTKNTTMLCLCIPHMQIAEVVLKGIQAVAWALRKQIPQAAKALFKGLGQNVKAEDVPTSFVLPLQAEVEEQLLDDGNDTQELGLELGALIARWSNLSMS